MKMWTGRREAIARVLKSTVTHPSAQWVYERAREDVSGIGMATVYRTLRLLVTKGEVVELRLPDGSARYDGNTTVHYHFCCERCGGVDDLDELIDRAIEERVSAKKGVRVTGHVLMLTGLCADCQTLEASRSKTLTGPGQDATTRAEAPGSDERSRSSLRE